MASRAYKQDLDATVLDVGFEDGFACVEFDTEFFLDVNQSIIRTLYLLAGGFLLAAYRSPSLGS